MVLDLILGKRKLSNAWNPLTRSAVFGVSSNSSSGVAVTPESSLGLPAYLAAISNVSEDLAKLPLPVYRRLDRGRTPLPDHRLNTILNVEFNESTAAMIGRQTLESWALGYGNGYAEIETDGRGQALRLHPIHPTRVSPFFNKSKELFYRVTGPEGYFEFPAYRVFHIPGRLSDDGVTGISMAQAGRNSIGRGLAAQSYGGTVFGSGGQERLALKHPTRLSPTAAQNIRDSWKKAYGTAEAGVAVLEEGMDAVKIGIPPKDAQLIETENWSVEDVARLFRCPPSKIGHFQRAQGWSTLEMLNTDYVTDTLLSRAIRWEQEIGRKLLVGLKEGDLYAKHNFMSLLRGDSAARSAFYTAMLRLGVMNRDEIREREEMNPVEGGEVYYIEGSNLQPIKPGGDDGGAAEDLGFKRDVVKALIADGTIGDVIFNLTEGKKLLQEVNIPTTPEAAEPWLPVIADNGQPVSGEVVKDSEGDIVGGDTEEPEPQASQQAPGDQQPGDGEDDQSGSGGKPQDAPPKAENNEAMAAAQAAVTHAYRRLSWKECTAARRAFKRTMPIHSDAFREWANEFYGKFDEEAEDVAGPAIRVLLALGGQCETTIAYVNRRRSDLLAVLRDEGADGVEKRLKEWEYTNAN